MLSLPPKTLTPSARRSATGGKAWSPGALVMIETPAAAIFAPIKKAPVRPVWLSNDRRPDSDKPPVEIPESLKRSVGMKPEE